MDFKDKNDNKIDQSKTIIVSNVVTCAKSFDKFQFLHVNPKKHKNLSVVHKKNIKSHW